MKDDDGQLRREQETQLYLRSLQPEKFPTLNPIQHSCVNNDLQKRGIDESIDENAQPSCENKHNLKRKS